MAQGQVKIKEMGLPKGHPEKDGVLVDLKDIVPEVQKRLAAAKEGVQLAYREGKVVGEGEKVVVGDGPAA